MEQLTETRADAVDHSAAELRRLERDLHDGAQARLVALSLSLGMADEMFDRDPDGARRLVGDARDTTDSALAELRSVVRGIHPPVLADRGLVGAAQALALDMAIPVRVDASLDGRPPAPVESAVYFAVGRVPGQRGEARRRRQRMDPDRAHRRRAARGDRRRRAWGRRPDRRAPA